MRTRFVAVDRQTPLLALVVYCYANGVFGSRRFERATYRDIAVRMLTGDTHPDHDTIAKFRRENLPAVPRSGTLASRLSASGQASSEALSPTAC